MSTNRDESRMPWNVVAFVKPPKVYNTYAEYGAMLRKYPWPTVYKQLDLTDRWVIRHAADVVYERTRLIFWQSQPESASLSEIVSVLQSRLDHALDRLADEYRESVWLIRYLQENAE